jgi:probable rRNA maturation factor
MANVSPAGLPESLPDGQDEPEPDSPGPDSLDKDRPSASTAFGIDIQCDDARWNPYLVLVETRLGALVQALALPAHGEVSVKLTDDRQISELNSGFRGKSGATNVLSFPAQDFTTPAEQNIFPDMPFSLGDIVLAFDTLACEAGAADKDFADHLTHLLVHGLLHLLGYDHQNDADAVQMEAREIVLLAGVGVDDPYGAASAETGKAGTGRDKR